MFQFDFLKHCDFEFSKCWLRERTPHIMTKIEQAVSMNAGLSNMEVGVDEGYQNGVEDIIQKLVEDLPTFVDVRL